MAKLIDLHGHVAFNKRLRLVQTCKPLLQNTPVTYFCHTRLFADGAFTCLFTMSDVAEYFFERDVFYKTWLIGIPFNSFESGISFWDINAKFWDINTKLNTHKQNEITNVLKTDMKLPHGIDIIDKNDAFCDLYCFASNQAELYCYPINYFRRFIFYYKQECRDLIKQAIIERIKFNTSTQTMESIPIFSSNKLCHNIGIDDFDIKRFYLNGNSDIYLTNKEVVSLNKIANGKTAKEAARIMGISNRTVEQHLARVKNKLGCSQITDAIMVAKEQGIIV